LRRNPLYILSFFIFCFIAYSCNPTRTLVNGEFLVKKNVVIIDNEHLPAGQAGINKDELSSYIKQKPNRKFLGIFRLRLALYNIATKGKRVSRTDTFLINTAGEPPVILDTFLTEKSLKQINLYLNSKGYFNSDVRKEIDTLKKRKAIVKYIIHASLPYKIKNITYIIEDDAIRGRVLGDTAKSLLKKGNVFDVDVLQNERERITNNLKNVGYYSFAKEYISYDVDSTLGTHQLNISMNIVEPFVKSGDYNDSLVKAPHKRYTISSVNIYTQYSPLDQDTTKYKMYKFAAAQRKKDQQPVNYNFVFKDTLRIKPYTVTQSVFIQPGDYFNLKDVDETYKSLTDLKMYKFVNIHFNIIPQDSINAPSLLNCIIQLTRTPVQSITYELGATNSAGNLGIAGDVLYQNKNIFRGAEILKLKVNLATEIQKVLGESSGNSDVNKLLPFNTLETGADAEIDIPKFLIPIPQEYFPKYFKPETDINMGVNYERRPDYTRYISNITYGYQWKESPKKKHLLYLADVDLVKIYPTASFDSLINSLNDIKIQNSYKDHLILALKYSFIYNDQQLSKSNDFSYFRFNFETSGNLLRGIDRIIDHQDSPDTSYSIFKINYAEYIRADIDARHYFIFDKLNTLAIRGAIGAGYAYWNSDVLPFEKSFYCGGANSVRAWQIYSLGPGSYSNPNPSFDETGDIDLEGNAEYRFPVYNIIKGAVFIDAGNVWLNKKNDAFPGGDFEFNRFYKEIAIGSGIGVRFDFSFFVIRLDVAFKIRNPSVPEVQRWVDLSSSLRHPNLNFGIGYPF
jgi:outer membrane protein assembly factor BamA